MKKIFSFLFLLLPFVLIAQLQYPETKKGDVVEDYHGTKVADPYRWLEDDNSEETKAWVQEENKVTQDYLSKIPYRDKIKKRIEEMWNYPKYGAPFRKGDYYYFTKNNGLQNQAVWYQQKGMTGKPGVFIDPNKLSEDGTVSLGSINFSLNGKYMAYTVQKSGSDWQEGYVMDVATRKQLGDKLDWLKFTGFSWKSDDGFYYSRYPAPEEGNTLKGKNINQQVYYHKIGTSQSADKLIYQDKEHPQRFAGVGLTEDERFLILGTSEGTSGGEGLGLGVENPLQQQFTFFNFRGAQTAKYVGNIVDELIGLAKDGRAHYEIFVACA